MRQHIKNSIARERHTRGKQLQLDLACPSVIESGRLWEYAVMVTDVNYPLEAIGQLYRDRADCENGFDELKNQWGLSDFTTQDINRGQTTARACALVYNWWSWYCRAAHPNARMEAITSRPLLLSAVGTVAHHGGQTTLYLTPHTWQDSCAQISDSKYLCGHSAYQRRCGAVQSRRPLGSVVAICHQQNCTLIEPISSI